MDIRNDLIEWNWKFGKTPRFTIVRSFPIPRNLLSHTELVSPDLSVTMVVDKGKISDIIVYVPPGISKSEISENIKVVTSLKGCQFTEDALSTLDKYMENLDYDYSQNKNGFVPNSVRKVIKSV